MSISTTTTPVTVADVIRTVNSNLPNLVHGEIYSLEDLVGKKYWNTIPKKQRTHLGHAFKTLATSGDLPVSFTGRSSSNKALYELKQLPQATENEK